MATGLHESDHAKVLRRIHNDDKLLVGAVDDGANQAFVSDAMGLRLPTSCFSEFV